MEAPQREAQQLSPTNNGFDLTLQRHGLQRLQRRGVRILQVNLGKLCNQACKHCHVEAGPKRTEIMEEPVVSRVLALAAHPAVACVDLTGGAPEMNPHFRRIVRHITSLGTSVIVRCNLTIVEEPGYEWLAAFYAEHRVHLVCSLPCYSLENVEAQRGRGVFDKSIAALQKLNALGYGVAGHGAGLTLDLVYNPVGTFLPPSQAGLEADYRRELGKHFGISFSGLLALANMPIGRYADALRRSGELAPYMALLEGSFNPDTVPQLMCMDTLSIGWDGKLYDCDFNQMLELPVGEGARSILDDNFRLEALTGGGIVTDDHCLGCTAGSGSSCGGALT